MTTNNPDTKLPITIVTTCMQRLDFLKQTLPTWLEYTSLPIVVVDYSCPDGTARWIAEGGFGSRVSVVRHEAETIAGRRIFNPSRARNTGAAVVENGYLLFLDADTQLGPSFQDWLGTSAAPEVMLAVVGRASPLFGALGVHKDIFHAIGGYDEGFIGWGGEDLDIRIRLHLAGLKCVPMPADRMRTLPHSDALRSRNSADPDFARAKSLNGKYFHEKLLRTTGRSFSSWISDRAVDCLCLTAAAEARVSVPHRIP